MKEPEEIIEGRIVELLRTEVSGTLEVCGALAPFPEGTEKVLSETAVSVFVDLASQNLDWLGGNVPCSFSARIAVRYAKADDATGRGFRDACRAVRSALSGIMGDGCVSLNADGFECDLFTLDATSTDLDQDPEYGGWTKTYNATLTGRFTTRKEDN